MKIIQFFFFFFIIFFFLTGVQLTHTSAGNVCVSFCRVGLLQTEYYEEVEEQA